jgi:phenylacetic acid degradation operon negative regulatory protein
MGFGKAQRSVWSFPYGLNKEVSKYLKKLKLLDSVYQLLVEDFEGLTGKEIAAAFWDLQSLHDKYIEFCRDWTEKLSQLQKLEDTKKESANYDMGIFQKCVRRLTWDYQAILSQDPHLPMELLPDDWGGKIAKEFVETCRQKFPVG